jgi:hypothetical protein
MGIHLRKIKISCSWLGSKIKAMMRLDVILPVFDNTTHQVNLVAAGSLLKLAFESYQKMVAKHSRRSFANAAYRFG